MIREKTEAVRAFKECRCCGRCDLWEMLSVLSGAKTMAEIHMNTIGLKALDDGGYSVYIGNMCDLNFFWNEPDAYNIRVICTVLNKKPE